MPKSKPKVQNYYPENLKTMAGGNTKSVTHGAKHKKFKAPLKDSEIIFGATEVFDSQAPDTSGCAAVHATDNNEDSDAFEDDVCGLSRPLVSLTFLTVFNWTQCYNIRLGIVCIWDYVPQLKMHHLIMYALVHIAMQNKYPV